MKPAIIIKDISKSFGTVKALDGIHAEVMPGELFGWIGPDGAGKTTLFRILTTLLIPDQGKATMGGLDVVGDFKTIRQKLGYMPGRFSLYQDLSVDENLQFFASIFNVPFDENFSLIRDIYNQLAPFRNRLAGKLSGGMKQKLALCCALIHKPEILVLDEPTTGVDAVSRGEFWQMLRQLKKEGITIIVSTPYMDEAVLCDRVALIQKGNILQIDTPEKIVEGFSGKIYSVKARDNYLLLQQLKEYSRCRAAYPFGESLHVVPADESVDEQMLFDYLEPHGHADLEIKQIKPHIEDRFMELMSHATTE